MTNWSGSGGGWGIDAPVFDTNFEYQFGDRRWPYPDVWITVQQHEPTNNTTGRNCVWHYTPDTDPDGSQALSFGADYYNEGMSCDPRSERRKRIMCFQAAELLYLHASSKGNAFADLNLGYVYSYDRLCLVKSPFRKCASISLGCGHETFSDFVTPTRQCLSAADARDGATPLRGHHGVAPIVVRTEALLTPLPRRVHRG